MSAEYLSIFRFVRARLTETGGAWGIGCGKSKEIVPGVYAAVTSGHLICTFISENQVFKKLRSVSNLRKISGPAHLIFFSVDLNFFSVCQLDFFQICTINLKEIQVTN